MRRASLAVLMLTVILAIAATVLILLTSSAQLPDAWGIRGASPLFAVICGSVGAIVVQRRPGNAIGWIFNAIGLLFAIQAFVETWTVAAVLVVPGGLPGEQAFAWLLTWLWIPPVALAIIFLPLLFPDGRFPSRRWRPVAWLGVVAIIAAATVQAVSPGPVASAPYIDNPFPGFGIGRNDVPILQAVALIPFWIASALAMVSLVRRYRAADDVQRRQIRWFAFAAAVCGATFVVYAAAFVLNGGPDGIKFLEVPLQLSIVGIPIAAGIAILRYRLYEIDRIISRSISYAVVSGILATVFVITVVAVQFVLTPLTDGQTIPVAASTLVVFAIFQPVLRRVRRAVDRRFDRARYDAERTAAAFSERLRDQVDLRTVTDDLAATAGAALAPTSLDVWLRGGDR